MLLLFVLSSWMETPCSWVCQNQALTFPQPIRWVWAWIALFVWHSHSNWLHCELVSLLFLSAWSYSLNRTYYLSTCFNISATKPCIVSKHCSACNHCSRYETMHCEQKQTCGRCAQVTVILIGNLCIYSARWIHCSGCLLSIKETYTCIIQGSTLIGLFSILPLCRSKVIESWMNVKTFSQSVT